MKSANGMGSVYKKNIKSGVRYVLKISYWDFETQKLKRKVKHFKTRKEAEEERQKYLINKGAYVKTVKFKTVLDKWKDKKFNNIKKASLLSYTTNIKKLKCLEEKDIKEIKRVDLEKLINIETVGTRKILKSILKNIFKEALKMDLINKNIVDEIDVHTEKVYKKKPFTEKEIKLLWQNLEIKGVKEVLILIYTGMRKEEFINLTIYNVKNNYIEILESKTENGIRKIPIIKEIRPLLKDLVTLAVKRNDNKISRCTYGSLNYTFKNYLPKRIIGLSKHTPHEARHTTATLLKEKGIPTELIARMLGHSNDIITKKIYIHDNENKIHEELQKALENIKIS